MISRAIGSHLLAVGLLGADLSARIHRLRVLVRATGASLGVRDSLCVNAWADLGSAVSPMRLGGEPARLLGLRVAKVPLGAAVAALTLETALVAALLLAAAGATWWRETGAALVAPLAGQALIALMVAGLVVVVRRRWRARKEPAGPVPALSLGGARVAAVAALCTLTNVGARLAILPMLVWGTGVEAPVETVLVGSFLLIYGQLLAPTPAGAGLIDGLFLHGVAGVGDPGLLLWWRCYTTLAGAGLGVSLVLLRLTERRRLSRG
jgi:uncharacterized membrane protein YbhN (UPF0104 family)